MKMHAQKLILIIFSFFILTDGHSKLLSEFGLDYVNGVRKSHSNLLDANVDDIINFEKINDIVYKILRENNSKIGRAHV